MRFMFCAVAPALAEIVEECDEPRLPDRIRAEDASFIRLVAVQALGIERLQRSGLRRATRPRPKPYRRSANAADPFHSGSHSKFTEYTRDLFIGHCDVLSPSHEGCERGPDRAICQLSRRSGRMVRRLP
jgi:hypothetical protein